MKEFLDYLLCDFTNVKLWVFVVVDYFEEHFVIFDDFVINNNRR